MTMVSTVTSRLVDRAREMGVSQTQLARWSKVDEARIAAIVEGDAVPTSSEFERIALFGLGVDPGALYRGAADQPHRSTARFRTATSLDQPSANDVRLLSLGAELGRVLGGLIEALGRNPRLSSVRSVEPIKSGRPVWEQGYELGEQARRRMVVGHDPVESVAERLYRWDVHVAEVQFDDEDIDAASIVQTGALPIVLLNRDSRRVQYTPARRAVLAHELCHLLHDSDQEADLLTRVSRGRKATPGYGEAVEKRARAFAPAFLAPRDKVRNWVKAHQVDRRPAAERVTALATYWGLSWEGAAWHAKNCGLVADDDAERLARLAAPDEIVDTAFETWTPPALGLRRHGLESDALGPTMTGRAAALVIEAVGEEIISRGRARELLSWR